MAHELEMLDNGQASMAWAGQTPWHGLGVKVGEDLTPQEMLVAAGLDWKVVPRQLYFDLNGKRVKVDRKALVRDTDNKPLTVITKDWNPVQNDEAFSFFDELVKNGNMKMHTAGSLLGGKKVWALAKINESFELKVDGRVTQDKVEGHLLFTNPHEYGCGLDVRFTPIRVVCNNTHTMAMRGSKGGGCSVVKLDHRRKFSVERLHELLGTAHLTMDSYKEAAELLAKVRYSSETLKEFMATVFPNTSRKEEKSTELSRSAKAAIELVDSQPGAEFAPGTLWNAYNASTFYMDHVMGRDADTRMTSAWFGHNRTRKDTALNAALKLAA